MYTIETIEKLLQDYPFHQYPQTNEHLEGDIRRFSILRDQILDQIASKNSDQGIIKKMLEWAPSPFLVYTQATDFLKCIKFIRTVPLMLSHNTTVDLSKYDQKKLINKDPEEFFDAYFQCQAPTVSE